VSSFNEGAYRRNKMNNTEFGKDLGIMHELVVTGRKVGFGRNEWVKLTHSDTLMRATLNFIRSVDASNFPPTFSDTEKVTMLAMLTKIALPYVDGPGCIDCGDNAGQGKRIGQNLIQQYEEIGLMLSEKELRCLKNGGCHQPLEGLWKPLAKEILGIEFPKEYARRSPSGFHLHFIATKITSASNLFAFNNAVKKEYDSTINSVTIHLDFAKE